MLRRLAMLRGCSDADIERLAELVTPVEVEAGHILVAEGATDKGAYLVIEGWASVLSGNRTIFSLGVGQFVGELANLRDQPRSATVRAATPMTLVAVAPERFDDFTSHPAVSQRLTESLAQRVQKALESPERP